MLSGNNTLASAIQANHMLINGQDIGEVAAGTRLDELLDHINNDMHGIKASTLVELEGTKWARGFGDGDSLTLSVSRLDGTTNTFSVSNTRNLAELADAISTATGGQVRQHQRQGVSHPQRHRPSQPIRERLYRQRQWVKWRFPQLRIRAPVGHQRPDQLLDSGGGNPDHH